MTQKFFYYLMIFILFSTSLASAQDFIPMLGAEIIDDKIQNFMNTMETEPEIIRFSTVYCYCYKAEGVELKFNNSHELLMIFLFAEGEADYRQYKGKLPYGLKFTDTREKVERLIGKPSSVNESENYRYNVLTTYLSKIIIIQYNSVSAKNMGAKIREITIIDKQK